MSDSESFPSDDIEFFTNDFTESIPDDSDSSDGGDDDLYSNNISCSTLTLDVGLSFSSWKLALINWDFLFVKGDLKRHNLN